MPCDLVLWRKSETQVASLNFPGQSRQWSSAPSELASLLPSFLILKRSEIPRGLIRPPNLISEDHTWNGTRAHFSSVLWSYFSMMIEEKKICVGPQVLFFCLFVFPNLPNCPCMTYPLCVCLCISTKPRAGSVTGHFTDVMARMMANSPHLSVSLSAGVLGKCVYRCTCLQWHPGERLKTVTVTRWFHTVSLYPDIVYYKKGHLGNKISVSVTRRLHTVPLLPVSL